MRWNFELPVVQFIPTSELVIGNVNVFGRNDFTRSHLGVVRKWQDDWSSSCLRTPPGYALTRVITCRCPQRASHRHWQWIRISICLPISTRRQHCPLPVPGSAFQSLSIPAVGDRVEQGGSGLKKADLRQRTKCGDIWGGDESTTPQLHKLLSILLFWTVPSQFSRSREDLNNKQRLPRFRGKLRFFNFGCFLANTSGQTISFSPH